jgi:hypothetical protein
MRLHTHTYTCMHACMHSYIHAGLKCIHTYIHTYTHTHKHTYIHMHTHMHTHTDTHRDTYTHTYTHTHTHVQASQEHEETGRLRKEHKHTCIHTQIHTETHTHIHTHTHTHVQASQEHEETGRLRKEHKHTCIHTQIHTHTNTHTHTHTYTYTYIQASQDQEEEVEKLRQEHTLLLNQARNDKQQHEHALANQQNLRTNLEKKLREALDTSSRQAEALASEHKTRIDLEETFRGALEQWTRENDAHKRVLREEKMIRMQVEDTLCREIEERDRLVDEHQRRENTLQEELQRERNAREASHGRLQQLERELLQRECNSREASHGRLQQLERELLHGAKRHVHESEQQHSQVLAAAAHISTISYLEIEQATDKFSTSGILGSGGFGPVFSGTWRGQNCAIKVLNSAEPQQQGTNEFLREVSVLGVYQHANLVPLLGFCNSWEGESLFCALVYPRLVKSLEDALRRSDKSLRMVGNTSSVLTADQHVVIALDAASGLAYLHSSDLKPVILHRDIKSLNILLDAHNRACISDVGHARQWEAGSSQAGGPGTLGYMDKECQRTGEFTPSSDVFAFGVVMLELLTGKGAMDSKKRPPELHARFASRLKRNAVAVADPVAHWLPPVVELFAGVVSDCISMNAAERPVCDAVVSSLARMLVNGGEPKVVEVCIICMDASRRTRLRPCFHVVFCEGCAEAYRLEKRACPICCCAVEDYEVGDFYATYVPV